MKQTAFTMSKIAVHSPFAFSVVDENGAKRWMIATDDEFEKQVDMKYMKTKAVEMMRYNLEGNKNTCFLCFILDVSTVCEKEDAEKKSFT